MGTHPIFESDFDCLTDVSGRFKMGENEEEEVTPEQTDLIVQFSAATGTEDLDQCAANLRMHDWDLSAAIATTMAPDPNRAAPVANIDTEESIPTVESESNDSIHSLFGSRSDNDGIRNRDVPEAPPIGPIQLPPNNQTDNAVVERSFFVRLFSTMVSLSNLLFTSPIRIAQNEFKLVSGWWTNLGPELTPIQQVTKFGIDFNKTYDTSIPWLNCSYYSAVSSIRTSLRPIIVFISNYEKKTDNAIFAQSLIDANNQMKDRVQFWGIDISCSEGARTAEMLFVHSYPAVLIIGLKNNQQNCLYRALTPSASISQLINKIEMAEAELVTARHELEMRDMDRRLREEQDLEFQRTMEADRKRIEEENKKKQEEEDKIRAAEEKANERIRRVTEHRDRRISARNTLAPEPKEGGLCILIKLPDGSRHPRKFLPDALIQDVFMFVQSLDASPGDYFLSTVFPTRKIPRDMGDASIRSLGIKNNEQLMVQAIREFSSDESDESDDTD